jgi:hypothetical protein
MLGGRDAPSASRFSLLRGTMGQMADASRLLYACAAGSLFHEKKENPRPKSSSGEGSAVR